MTRILTTAAEDRVEIADALADAARRVHIARRAVQHAQWLAEAAALHQTAGIARDQADTLADVHNTLIRRANALRDHATPPGGTEGRPEPGPGAPYASPAADGTRNPESAPEAGDFPHALGAREADCGCCTVVDAIALRDLLASAERTQAAADIAAAVRALAADQAAACTSPGTHTKCVGHRLARLLAETEPEERADGGPVPPLTGDDVRRIPRMVEIRAAHEAAWNEIVRTRHPADGSGHTLSSVAAVHAAVRQIGDRIAGPSEAQRAAGGLPGLLAHFGVKAERITAGDVIVWQEPDRLSGVIARHPDAFDARQRPVCGHWAPLFGPCVCGDPARHAKPAEAESASGYDHPADEDD